jgi:hypothetical protein
MTHSLIVGYGEIGKAIKEVLGEPVSVVDKDEHLPTPDAVDVMHVCFPYSDDFLLEMGGYIDEYAPSHIIIYSTLPIGTTKQIPKAVHSPVEGKHPALEDSIRLMERWIGYNDKEEWFFFNKFFQSLGLRTKAVEGSDCTEALKLLSTTEYGLNIEFARYKAMVAESIGMDFQLTKDWNEEYNKLYKNLGMEKKYQKFVLDAPEGAKGGHCIVPNALILDEQYPNDLVAIVGEI